MSDIYLVSEWDWKEGFGGGIFREAGCMPIKAFYEVEDAIGFAITKMREYLPGACIVDMIQWAEEYTDTYYEGDAFLLEAFEQWSETSKLDKHLAQAPESVRDWLNDTSSVPNNLPLFVLDAMAKTFWSLLYKVERIELH